MGTIEISEVNKTTDEYLKNTVKAKLILLECVLSTSTLPIFSQARNNLLYPPTQQRQ